MKLFTPLRLREVELRNRIVVSPMCQYSADDGHVGAWHMVHLGSRAVGGAALVMAEATAVQRIGRISTGDTGIYLDSHVENWRPIIDFIHSQGAVAGIQLAHAGRKASTDIPWLGGKPISPAAGGWIPVGPSPVPFDAAFTTPTELSLAEIDELVTDFQKAAKRALAAGFQIIELHGAHGYLINEFLSPFSNQRTDKYGGSFDNRVRLLLDIVKKVREVWPEKLPLFVRLSATEWKEGGWDLPQSVELAKRLKVAGVDLVDASSGGNVPGVKIPIGPGYQTSLAATIRRDAGIAVGAVGIITDAAQAETIISTEQADLVFLAREMLRDPYWPRRAAAQLGVKIKAPSQYERAW
jgi:2,4-dienoyl-CoA reductase-like NADH-dependent reductase (Old Yellow Enzyme family)